MDFEEAERRALEEAERIKQLGYDRQKEEEESRARKEAEALQAAASKKAMEIGPNKANVMATNGTSKNLGSSQKAAAFPRLGFGAIPGAGAAAVAAAASSRPRHVSASYLSCPP